MREPAVWYDAARGTWTARLYAGTNKVTGKPVRPQKDFPQAASEQEAREMAREYFAGLDALAALGTTARVSDLLGRYLQAHAHAWAPNTARSYRTCAGWVSRACGKMAAADLDGRAVEDLYAVLAERGGARGQGLSGGSLRLVHHFLGGFLAWLARAGVVAPGVMEGVAKPRAEPSEARALGEGALRALLAELSGRMAREGAGRPAVWARTNAFCAFLALATGMRAGEVCALRACDVSGTTVHVRGTVVEVPGEPPRRQAQTKGRRPRSVEVGPAVAEAVRSHAAWQASFLPPAALADDARPLACTPEGGLLRPASVSRAFARTARELGLPAGTTFHTLRHTHASYMVAAGVDFRTVQERLGHASPSTTLGLYAHAMPGRDAQAAAGFEEILGGAPWR